MSFLSVKPSLLRDPITKQPIIPITSANAVKLMSGRTVENEVSLLRIDADRLANKNDSYDQKIEDLKGVISSGVQLSGIGSNQSSDVLIKDRGAYYSGTTVESALQEVGANLKTLNRVVASTDIQYLNIQRDLYAIKLMLIQLGAHLPGDDEIPLPILPDYTPIIPDLPITPDDTPTTPEPEPEPEPSTPVLEALVMNFDLLELPEGGFEVLRVTPTPSSASNEVQWSSSNTSVATIANTGYLTAIKAGQTTITARSLDNPSVTATCDVTVTSKIVEVDYTGLIINQVYGGGSKQDNSQSVSHSFIELYNKTNQTLNLNGLSVQYSKEGNSWEKLNLRGEIPPKHSFLIRCGMHADSTSTNTFVFIEDYDLDWSSIRIHNKGFKVALLENTNLLTVVNPFDIDGNRTKVEGYIDMIGAAGNDEGLTIDGYENRFIEGQSKQKSIRRINFKDTDDNLTDCEVVDFRQQLETYNKIPRYLAYGPWNSEDETDAPEVTTAPFEPDKANYIVNAIGSDGATERIISWNTGTSATSASLILMNMDTGVENTYRSSIKTFTNDLGSMLRHSVTLTGLLPLTSYSFYIRVGTNNSESYIFTTAAESENSFSFLQITDTQPNTSIQCQSTRTLLDKMETQPYDFIVHTGDIVNNTDVKGASEQEWRYILDALGPHMANKGFLTCPGNNDLDTGMSSLNGYYSHFGATSDKGCYSFMYQGTFFASVNIELYTDELNNWLKEELASTKARGANWRIVLVHRTRYTSVIDDSAEVTLFTKTIEAGGVEFVLQGHKHMYMRTRPILDGFEDESGVVYLMGNPSGTVQTSGKASQWWYELHLEPMKPAVNQIRITPTTITVDAKILKDNEIVPIDTFTITK